MRSTSASVLPTWSSVRRISPAGYLRYATDAGLAALLFAAPLFMGGRHPLGQLVFVSLVGVTTLTWVAACAVDRDGCSWSWSGAELLCLLAVLLVALQLVPLPRPWLNWLSPHGAQLLPLWQHPAGSTGDWPAWNRISLAPGESRRGLAVLLAYVLLFLVGVQRLRTTSDIQRLVKAVALAGSWLALLGLAQYLFSNGRFLWLYEHPSRDTLRVVKGPFANENHLAHLLALALGPALWWLWDVSPGAPRAGFRVAGSASTSTRRMVPAIGLGLIVLAGLLTFSRGGILMLALGAAVCGGLFLGRRLASRRAWLPVACVGAVVVAAVSIHGEEILVRELHTAASADLDRWDQHAARRKIWRAAWQGIMDFPVFGCGAGAHRDIYPTYFDEETSVHYTHADSGYLQVGLETGTVGLALLLAGLALSGCWVARGTLRARHRQHQGLAGALAAAWTVSVVHAVADFHWYLPACMTVTLLLLAATVRLDQLVSRGRAGNAAGPVCRPATWRSLGLAAALLALLSVVQCVAPALAAPYWDEYLGWSLAANRPEQSLGPGRQRRIGPVDRSAPETLSVMVGQLQQALRHHPADARGHVRLAALYLRQFESRQQAAANAMGLAQIRDAALTADFASQQQLHEWIDRAVGPQRGLLDRALRHARWAVQLAPLLGHGYLFLHELAFLEADRLPAPSRLLEQALRVRPYDGSVQFVCGREQLLSGNVDEGLRWWQRAFRGDTDTRGQIVQLLAPQMTAADFVALFEPDLQGYQELFAHYRDAGRTDQLLAIGPAYTEQLAGQARLLSGTSAAEVWFRLQAVHHVLGNAEQAAETARKAVASQPNRFHYRHVLAVRLKQAGCLEEACEQLRWCQLRRPADPELSRQLQQWRRELRVATVGQPGSGTESGIR
jgi:tetratricopeptide (TPR) repeat protein